MKIMAAANAWTAAAAGQLEAADAEIMQRITETTSARAEWDALDGAAQWEWLIRQTWSSYNKRDARQRPDGSEAPNLFAWVSPAHVRDDLETVAAEAWIITTQDVQRMPEKPLALIIAGAVGKAAYNINYHEHKHANAARTDKDGNTTIDTAADPRAERIAPAPEDALIGKEYIDEITAGDALNRDILASLAIGYTQTETAHRLHISQQTVSYRYNKMRDTYHSDK